MSPNKLMEGYEGVKFSAKKISSRLPSGAIAYYRSFKRTCNKLKHYGMTYANAGNISIRFKNGILITSSGSNLGCLKKTELSYVAKCSQAKETVCYNGRYKPSSETFLHWMIYSKHPKILAIIHAHDEVVTSKKLKGTVKESIKELSYGTLDLAKMAVKTLKGSKKIIVLKNHGYVSVGISLKEACDRIVATHKVLIKKT